MVTLCVSDTALLFRSTLEILFREKPANTLIQSEIVSCHIVWFIIDLSHSVMWWLLYVVLSIDTAFRSKTYNWAFQIWLSFVICLFDVCLCQTHFCRNCTICLRVWSKINSGARTLCTENHVPPIICCHSLEFFYTEHQVLLICSLFMKLFWTS
jgi:hypothetical protein